jgi:hypothetical protein
MKPPAKSDGSVWGLTVDEAVTYAISDAAVGPDGQRIPIKHVAALCNIPLAVVYDIASGRRPARANELAVIVRATRCTAPADTIERDINRVGVALPVIAGNGDAAMGQAAKALIEFGEYITTLGEAAADRRYTRDEARDLRAKAEHVVSAIFASVQQVEHEAGVIGLVKPTGTDRSVR